MKLKDKVVVITGSSRGIGRAVAEACAKEGAKVVICSRNAKMIEETCKLFKGQGLNVCGISCDVSNHKDIDRLLYYAIDSWGKVDIWINNVGISGGYRPIDELSEDEIFEIIKINFIATAKACRIILPYFVEQGGGILINVSGKGGKGEASPNTAIYAATKAAVSSLTKSLAEEYKTYPISINAVIPGMVATDFIKDLRTSPKLAKEVKNIPLFLKIFGVPIKKVARLFVELASQKPGAVTGKIYSLTGGRKTLKSLALLAWYKLSGKLK